MQISIANAILVARLVGKSIVRRGLKMWLDFKKSNIIGCDIFTGWSFSSGWTADGTGSVVDSDSFNSPSANTGIRKSDVGLIDGKTYEVNVVGTTSGSFFKVVNYNVTETYSDFQSSGDFNLTFQIIANGTGFRLRSNSGQTDISTFSIKEVAQFAPDKSNNCNEAELFTGKALSFNGNDAVNIDGFTSSGTKATVAFWLNSTAATGYVLDLNSSIRFVVGFNNNLLKFYDGNGWKSFGSVTLYQYSRCVVILDGTTAKCFVNGNQLGSDVAIQNISLGTNSGASIGSNFDRDGSYFNGSLSDFQIYNAAWDEDDVAYDYANPNHLVIDNVGNTTITKTNLVGYWALSEGSGSIAYDSATPLGSDLVVNGDFATDISNWTAKDGTQAYSNNSLVFTTTSNSSGGPFQNIGLVNGSTYQLIMTMKLITSSSNGVLGLILSSGGGSGQNVVYTGSVLVSGGPEITEVITFTAGSGEVSIQPFADEANATYSLSNISVKEVSAGTITGATYVPRQTIIPQLGMVDWAKSTSDGTNEITLIQNPNELGKDILGNTLRLREGGLNLDGTGDAEVANDASLDFGTGDFSIETWAKARVGSGTINVIVSLGGNFVGNNSAGIGTHQAASKFLCYIGGSAMYSNDVFVVGDWYHLVITRDSGTCTLYVDTVAQDDTETNTNSITNALVKQLGRDISNDRFYTDVIDDTRMYNIALSQKEIDNNYKIGLSKHKN